MMMDFGNPTDDAAAPRGFTLVELMVTLALVAVLAAVAAPSFSNMMRQADGRSAARAMANQFRKARDHAMSRGSVVYAKVQKTGGTNSQGQVDLLKPNNPQASCRIADPSTTSSVETIEIAEFSANVGIQGASTWHGSETTWVCFSPSGEVLQGKSSKGEEFSSCSGHSWRLWIGEDVKSNKAKSLGKCDSSVAMSDKRYINNFWVVDVPYNGGIRVYQ